MDRQSLCDALLQATSELVMVLVDDRVEQISAGDNQWLNTASLTGKRLDEVLSKELLVSFRGAIERARLQSGRPEALAFVLRPEQLPLWRDAGLAEQNWFEARFVALTKGGLVCSARNVSTAKRLERKVTNQAQRDMVTGAYNRRALMTVMEQAVAQALRYDGVCSLLMIDVDAFSEINDRFGWDAGDKILREIVDTLERLKRTSDFLARYGDDRLVLFLGETNHEQAMAAGERYRRVVQQLAIPYANEVLRCTASVGVARLQTGDNPLSMLQRAEENLIVAISSGGNRVEGEELG